MRRTCIILNAVLLAAGCAGKPGELFPPSADAPVWPAPPAPARIRYVGQLATDADLKPGRSGLEGFGQALFGRKERHGMVSPYALCTDGGGRLFVVDSHAQLIHVFDLDARRYAQWKPGKKDPPFRQPVGIAYDAAGKRVLVADSVAGTLFAFDVRGVFLGEIAAGRLDRPCGIAVHPATGRIYVADVGSHQLVVLSSGGEELQRVGRRGAGIGEFNYPTAVALDNLGRVYVSDSLNFRVQQFSPDLRTAKQIGSKGDLPGYFSQPKGLATDRDGHLYVIDSQFETVQVFNPEGQVLMDFGSEGRGPGEFWLPTGICIDSNNRIWIADSYNQRVQVFEYQPEVQP